MRHNEFQIYLDNILSKGNITEKFVEFAKKENRNVILCGGGHACLYFVRYLRKRGIAISAIADKKRTDSLEGIPCLTLERIVQKFDTANLLFVISAPSVREELREELKAYVKIEQIFYFEVELYEYYGTNCDKYKSYLVHNKEEFASVYTLLEDDYSRQTMLKVIEGRLTGDLDTISDIWIENQYWPEDIIQFTDNETVIECGSSDGRTIKELIDKLENRYKHIYCFEPDLECKDVLLKVIEEVASKDKITYFEKGTYKESSILAFSNEEIASGLSKVDETGKNTIQVVAIDDVIKDKVTYIKMDIEGAELDTLIGARETIIRNKPKLAVCIYHKDSDLLEIIKYLQSLNMDYKYYIRHHNCNMTETVLYAV